MNLKQRTEIVAVLTKMKRQDLVQFLPKVMAAKEPRHMNDEELQQTYADLSREIGSQLSGVRDNLQVEIDEKQSDLANLEEIWDKSDYQELTRLGYISKSTFKELDKIQEEMDARSLAY